MSVADSAVAEIAPKAPKAKRHAALAQLARAPSIPRRRAKDAAPDAPKHVGVVLRRGMSQTEFRHIEGQLVAHGMSFLPILAGQRRPTFESAKVCGLVITGGEMAPTYDEQHIIATAVTQTIERNAPVLALSDAAGLALEAAGLEAPAGGFEAVLIHRGVRALKTQREVDEAIKAMAGAPAR